MVSYQERNKDRKVDYDKQYYLSNKVQKDKKAREYYRVNKEAKASYDKRNRPAQATKRRERYRTDVRYKLTCNLRSRLYVALKRNKKTAHTLELLGCSIDYLKQHIESQFKDGMYWAKVMNGEIHIDHIVPCVAFDLSQQSQQRECFHYSNLQPLWAKDNFKKHKKSEVSSASQE